MAAYLKFLVLFVALMLSLVLGLTPQLLDESPLSWSPVLLTLLGTSVGLLSLMSLPSSESLRQGLLRLRVLAVGGSLLLGVGALWLAPVLTAQSLLNLSNGLLVGLLVGCLRLSEKPLLSLPSSLLVVLSLLVLLSNLPLQLLAPSLSVVLAPTLSLVGGLLVGTVLTVSLFLDVRVQLLRYLLLATLPCLSLLIGAGLYLLLNQSSLVEFALGLLPTLGLLLGLVASLLPLLSLRDPEKLLLLRSLDSEVLSLN